MNTATSESRSLKRLVSLWCFRDGAMTRETQITLASAEKLTRQKLDARRCWCVFRHGRKHEPYFWCKVSKMWVPQANNESSVTPHEARKEPK